MEDVGALTFGVAEAVERPEHEGNVDRALQQGRQAAVVRGIEDSIVKRSVGVAQPADASDAGNAGVCSYGAERVSGCKKVRLLVFGRALRRQLGGISLQPSAQLVVVNHLVERQRAHEGTAIAFVDDESLRVEPSQRFANGCSGQ